MGSIAAFADIFSYWFHFLASDESSGSGDIVTRVKRPKTFLAIGFKCIAQEWHPTRNGSLTPDKVASGSGRRDGLFRFCCLKDVGETFDNR